MNRETAERLRENEVGKIRTALLSEGGQFDPYSSANVEEALGNLPKSEYKMLSIYLRLACMQRTAETEDILAANFKRLLFNYWTPYAQDEAERSVPSVEELMKETNEH